MEAIDQIATLWSWMDQGSLELAVWARDMILTQGQISLNEVPAGSHWRRLRHATRRLLAFMPPSRWPAQARFKITDLLEGVEALLTFTGHVSDPGVILTLGKVIPRFAELMYGCRRYIAPIYLDLGAVTLFALSPLRSKICWQRVTT